MNRPVESIGNASARTRGHGIFRSTKTYGHNEGLSCCFRQWRATHSHCRFIHGYALAFRFVFAAAELDQNHWCFDFGALKPVREWLKSTFDHTMLVAEDDPELPRFELLARDGLIDLRVLPATGCEAKARYTFDHVASFIEKASSSRVWLESVEVMEHSGNSAIYTPNRDTKSSSIKDATLGTSATEFGALA